MTIQNVTNSYCILWSLNKHCDGGGGEDVTLRELALFQFWSLFILPRSTGQMLSNCPVVEVVVVVVAYSSPLSTFCRSS